jgi:hypothetical protein
MATHRVSPPSRRLASLCLCVILTLALADIAVPATTLAALGGGTAFSELTEGGAETTPTQTTASTSSAESTSGSNSTTVVGLALVAAVVLLIGIAFVIVRDARRVAPVGDGPSTRRGSARDPAAELRRRRAKAKAARRQRKRNR